jgi:hypothetical protein
MLAELEEAQQCLAVIREAWADDRTCSSFESEPVNQNLRSGLH